MLLAYFIEDFQCFLITCHLVDKLSDWVLFKIGNTIKVVLNNLEVFLFFVQNDRQLNQQVIILHNQSLDNLLSF